jgi:hypothetical protein
MGSTPLYGGPSPPYPPFPPVRMSPYISLLSRESVQILGFWEQFKNAYIKSYGPDEYGNPNFEILESTKRKHMFNNGFKVEGYIRDMDKNEIIKNFEVSTEDELSKLIQMKNDLEAKGRSVRMMGSSGNLFSVKNGREVAEVLNIPLTITTMRFK